MLPHKYLLLKSLFVIILINSAFLAIAQESVNRGDPLAKGSFPVQNAHFLSAVGNDHPSNFPPHLNTTTPDLIFAEPPLFQNPAAGFANIDERKQLMAYLKQVTVNDNVAYTQTRIRRLYRLARFFTRLRLYPLAMKCFLKTMQVNEPDSVGTTDSLVNQPDSNNNYINRHSLDIDAKDDSLVENQLVIPGALSDKVQKSKAIRYEQIAGAFNDGKKAIAYAMIFHVKQPVRGKRKIFVLANTGHTFITLIKYNTDSSYAALSFGFYPKKDNILSATPIIPLTSSVFKNDSGHDWDEILGKFISKRRFEKILLLAKEYSNLQYHLSKNNCTDFGLRAASVGGLNIWDTSGSWPLGHGNNPGVTGQSVINGEFKNADTGNSDGLLIDVIAPATDHKK